MTVEEAAEYVALSFMQNSLDRTVEIASTTPFYDLDDTITAYCVSFSSNGQPSGYVLISLLHLDMPIVEFAFEGPGIVATIQNNENNQRSNCILSSVQNGSNNRIIYLGPGALYVKKDSTDSLCDVVTKKAYSESDIIKEYNTQKTMSTRSNFDVSAGILSWDNANINTNSIIKVPGLGSGSDYWLLKNFSNGNVCVPTCATNVLWYWGIQRGRRWCIQSGNKTGFHLASTVFQAMSLNMGTFPQVGTIGNFVQGAYHTFIGWRGSNFNTRVLTRNSYSDITAAIDNGCPVHTSLRTAGLIYDGHDVMTFGYGRSNGGINYLFVMDGWYPYGRFVKFIYYPVVEGLKVWVGETAQ